MVFSGHDNRSTLAPDVLLDGVKLVSATSTKLLGVIIDYFIYCYRLHLLKFLKIMVIVSSQYLTNVI